MDVLIKSTRPKQLSDLIGQEKIVTMLTNHFNSGSIQHFFLICGNSGTGKTTISRIIAMMLQKASITDNISKYDITEINASDKNGIDDVREIIDKCTNKPFSPSLAKVYILDEAHQLTTPAQNALLKITEDAPKSTYFIFCTTNESKIITALKRRAYIINTQGLTAENIDTLLLLAKEKVNSSLDTNQLKEALIKNEITSPGLILQCAEKYFNGCEANECIFATSNTNIDTMKLCNFLSKGSWQSAIPILKSIKKEDIVMIRACVLGYFKTILLNSGSLNIAKAIKIIGEECYELPIFLANLRLACEAVKVVKKVETKVDAKVEAKIQPTEAKS